MRRLPNLSAKRPHKGDITALTKKVAAKTAPDQSFIFWLAAPKSSKYNGKNGNSIV
jgi:hypothetical protein